MNIVICWLFKHNLPPFMHSCSQCVMHHLPHTSKVNLTQATGERYFQNELFSKWIIKHIFVFVFNQQTTNFIPSMKETNINREHTDRFFLCFLLGQRTYLRQATSHSKYDLIFFLTNREHTVRFFLCFLLGWCRCGACASCGNKTNDFLGYMQLVNTTMKTSVHTMPVP